jgi:ornithine lipid hydroxylase
MKLMRDVIRYGAYPGLMLAPLIVLWTLLQSGAPLTWAPYVAVGMVVPMILAAERLVPFRGEWTAGLADYLEDGLFMVAVQVAVPLALAWLATLALANLAAATGWSLQIWPGHWPIAMQLVLKVIAGDFLRYWLHRAAHTWTPLWRLHEVHHHPGKLYSTNVFRFHPLEKALQFLCDTLPFVMAGIGPEVLAYYFVFYATSGLFQHSNVDIRLGWFNYIFSGPEVHRWHHSRTIAESNNNYAHSFVVWDIVFGTYFRPKDRSVAGLGLDDAEYPTGFWNQLSAPFRMKKTGAP